MYTHYTLFIVSDLPYRDRTDREVVAVYSHNHTTTTSRVFGVTSISNDPVSVLSPSGHIHPLCWTFPNVKIKYKGGDRTEGMVSHYLIEGMDVKMMLYLGEPSMQSRALWFCKNDCPIEENVSSIKKLMSLVRFTTKKYLCPVHYNEVPAVVEMPAVVEKTIEETADDFADNWKKINLIPDVQSCDIL